jgi:hypothetical protein
LYLIKLNHMLYLIQNNYQNIDIYDQLLLMN